MAWWITGFLVAAGLVVALTDLVPIFRTWLSRIHIGRYEDQETWARSVQKRAVHWVNRTPTIKLTDQTRFVLLDRLRGNYKRSSIQQWQEGALLLGLGTMLRQQPDEAAVREVDRYLKRLFLPDGSWRNAPQHVDGAILAYAVMKLPHLDPDRFRPAFDATWSMIRDHLGEDGTVGYRKSMMKYRYVDTIGFICPFLTAYGIRYDKEECVELALRQLRSFERHGLHPGLFLPSHAYQVETKAPLGLYGWGRGLAWFALGLADTWNELPLRHPERASLERMVAGYAIAVLREQQPGGNWNWTVTRSEAIPDSSATASLAWFLTQAATIEAVSKECSSGADKALRYLMKVTRRNGAIDLSQGDTKDIGVYSTLFDILPFTQGFALRTHFAIRQNRVKNHDREDHERDQSQIEPLVVERAAV
ncbi:glycoside hydrolase family 88 protein [Gorillibacterium timonense]|uniref:glycoside hydrolase family 88 protein n=1 Tax=Gorillibacterium timonense TaxID=1689269 RepID=UPI0009E66679|nr:glycoside hydrolase family 88 protein [Gorillibacterium timonense]